MVLCQWSFQDLKLKTTVTGQVKVMETVMDDREGTRKITNMEVALVDSIKMVVAEPAVMFATIVYRMDIQMVLQDQVVQVGPADQVEQLAPVDPVDPVEVVDSEPEGEEKDPLMDFGMEINLDRKDVQAKGTKAIGGKWTLVSSSLSVIQGMESSYQNSVTPRLVCVGVWTEMGKR